MSGIMTMTALFTNIGRHHLKISHTPTHHTITREIQQKKRKQTTKVPAFVVHAAQLLVAR
jgi:hypothetical protein